MEVVVIQGISWLALGNPPSNLDRPSSTSSFACPSSSWVSRLLCKGTREGKVGRWFTCCPELQLASIPHSLLDPLLPAGKRVRYPSFHLLWLADASVSGMIPPVSLLLWLSLTHSCSSLSLSTTSWSSATMLNSSTWAHLPQVCSLLPSDPDRKLRHTLQLGAWVVPCSLGTSIWVVMVIPVVGVATGGTEDMAFCWGRCRDST